MPKLSDPRLCSFRLAAFDIGEDGEEDVELIVDTPSRPSLQRHASLALLYGLAIMKLDESGAISAMMDAILDEGPVSEVDAVNQITYLLKGIE